MIKDYLGHEIEVGDYVMVANKLNGRHTILAKVFRIISSASAIIEVEIKMYAEPVCVRLIHVVKISKEDVACMVLKGET